jgi:hypothetical protein
MSLRERVQAAIEQDRLAEIEDLIAGEPRTVRHLLRLSYRADEGVRRRAARGIALAARHHESLVQELVRRLVWAMNDESGTNALTAPAVVHAIAEEQPELLLPMVPDLVRLSADEGLREGLAETLRIVVQRCPGKLGQELQRSLNEKLAGGGCHVC